jgi:DNA-binding PadR family transcriptional regulator
MHRCSHHFFGGHHQGRGLGRFGSGLLGGSEMGGRAFVMGRKLASVDLQLLILRLLADKPRHGYEIIKALDEYSKGFYVPSPGMVYPALTYLEELGQATIESDGNRKLYHISDAGKQYLDEHRTAADAMLAQFARVAERMECVRRALNLEETGEDTMGEQERRGSKDLIRARRDLKLALADKWVSSPAEQERIAEVLRRAAAEIVRKEPRK